MYTFLETLDGDGGGHGIKVDNSSAGIAVQGKVVDKLAQIQSVTILAGLPLPHAVLHVVEKITSKPRFGQTFLAKFMENLERFLLHDETGLRRLRM
jgi:hypothetical protein